MKLKIFIFCIVICSFSKFSAGQASTEKFGRQRLQYNFFDWQYFDSTNFRLFYYGRHNKAIALHVLNESEKDLKNIVQLMGGRLPRKLNIILYSNYSDFIQTNLGRNNELQNEADGGKIEVTSDNIPIYFTGNQQDLRNQIRKGVANVIKDNMLFGDNIKDIIKNVIKMNLPDWYTLGYVNFIAEDWTAEKHIEVQSILGSDSTKSFNTLARTYPELIGASMWNFLKNNYNENTISNLLYLTRYRKNVQDALSNVTRKPIETIYDEWKAYCQKSTKIENDTTNYERTQSTFLKINPFTTYSQLTISPNGNQLAYVAKKEGMYKVFIQETKDQFEKELLNGGTLRDVKLNDDPNYPMLAWSQDGKLLAILYLKKNFIRINFYNTKNQKRIYKVIGSNKIERITGMCFLGDENNMIFSGIKKGKSDLFTYQVKRNRITQLTNDYFDDKSPTYIKTETYSGIAFLSNRTSLILDDPSLKENQNLSPNFNVFFLDDKVAKSVVQLSNSNKNIIEVSQFGPRKISYLEEENGEIKRKIINYVKTESKEQQIQETPSAYFPNSILHQEYLIQERELVEIIKENGQYTIFKSPFKNIENYELNHPAEIEKADTNVASNIIVKPKYITKYNETDSASYLMNLFLNTKKNEKIASEQLMLNAGKKKSTKYLATFYPDFIQTSIDNTLLFNRYQIYNSSTPNFQVPNLNGFLSTSLIDILEDYKITAGIRLPFNLQGTSYFVEFGNYRKRLDWKLIYFHQQTPNFFNFSNRPPPYFSPYDVYAKSNLDYFQSSWNYPFNVSNSLQAHIGLRYDRTIFKSQDRFSAEIPNETSSWGFSKLEYVYDNSFVPLFNIRKGERAKLFVEYYQQTSGGKNSFWNMGFDGRIYKGIYKNIISATRLAAGISGGKSKLLYYLGGVDNALSPKVDNSNFPNPDINYQFQTLATNLRGYKQQARNGTSNMVFNQEIRLPIANTFLKKPPRSSFIRNLQLVSFLDVGGAWEGVLPNAENIKMTKIFNQGKVTAILYNLENAIGVGYGAGLRTKLFGYFVRCDAAWNIEGAKKPMIHVSLATDF
ncbi:MAG: hypothetical protein KA275_03800 [Chitinophagaceae bacterium]|nr:hypothetical protein [Chitinophagaceae bacterium]